jgi:CubicO group peptidase (beta-lactamase class C family)
MRRALLTTLLVLAWTVAVVSVLFARTYWFGGPAVRRGDLRSIETHLVEKLEEAEESRSIGAAALVLLRNGEIVAEHGFGFTSAERRQPVNPEETLFQLASVSKAVTAWGVMTLVEEGKLDLDDPVAPHLKRWQLRGDERFRNKVAVRHLLSHTAGLDDGFGYGGFGPGEDVQTLEESLSFTLDSTVGGPRGAQVAWEPGTGMAYSGAGYAILQLLVEEITQRPFAEYMKEAVLQPLGMTKSSFDLDAIIREGRAAHLAPAFDRDLQVQPHRRYAAPAAVALHATPRDVARFAQAFIRPNRVLERETIRLMLEPQPGTSGTWGLGHTIFARNGAGGHVVGHSGGTYPAWGAMLRVNPETGNAMVLLVSGGSGALNRLPHDWVYWETGTVTAEARRQALYDQIGGGLAAIGIGAAGILFFRRRRALTPGPSPASGRGV